MSTLGHGSDKLSIKLKRTKEGAARIVNYITIGALGLMLERVYISHYSEYALSCTLLIYIIFIAIILKEYNAAVLCNSWF